MKTIQLIMISLLFAAVLSSAANTGTDPADKYAWGENVGWLNAQSANNDVTVHYYEGDGGWLSGYAWGENIGWIVTGSAGGGPYANTTAGNWGVNLAADGALTGYAWGENVGWINFEQTYGQPAIDPATGAFSGCAWGENIGWLKFSGSSPDYGVRTLAFDTQPQGTPNWWLDAHGVNESHDAGDGVPAWRKYVMDTDPNVPGDYLRITSISNAPAAKVVAFTPGSTRRYYTLVRTDELSAVTWDSVVGQVAVPGIGGGQTMQDTNTAARAFYRVKVTVEP
jgi:hypothetical protein